jgi:hypothetical protein
MPLPLAYFGCTRICRTAMFLAYVLGQALLLTIRQDAGLKRRMLVSSPAPNMRVQHKRACLNLGQLLVVLTFGECWGKLDLSIC